MQQIRKSINLGCAYIGKNIRSIYFFVAILLFAFFMIISILDDYSRGTGEGIHYYLYYAFINSYKAFLTIICAVPAVLNFSKEWRNDAFIYYYHRAGKKGYSFAICISAAITSFLIAILGSLLFVAFLSIREPFYPGNEILLSACIERYAYGYLMQSGNYIFYYSLTIVLQGLMSAFYSVVTVFISTIIIDPYLSLTSPMIICVFVTSLMNRIKIPRAINPDCVYSNTAELNYIINFGHLNVPTFFSFIYPFLYTFLAIAVFGLLTHVSLNRRIERGVRK